jgi:two-component system, response regulator PdtaR
VGLGVEPLGAGARKRILVVEDEPLIRMNSAIWCEDAGYEVAEASNAAEALAVLDDGEDICLVLTDVDMPGSMDGLQLARLASVKFALPVIVASGKMRPRTGELPLNAVFIEKPFQEAELVGAIRRLLAGEPGR